MKASLNLTAEDLLGIVECALGQQGYDVTGVRLFDSEGKPVEIARVIIDHEAAPLSIRFVPDEDKEIEDMRKMLHPEIKAHGRIFARRDQQQPAG